MKTIYLYHISKINLGNVVVLSPKVPEDIASNEDSTTKRVCACLTIPACIRASEVLFAQPHAWLDDGIEVWIYEADVPVENIVQPDVSKVPDVWFTGELWVIVETSWKLHSHAIICRYMMYKCKESMSNSKVVFSRYAVTADENDEVIDRIAGTTIYGYGENAFSMLEYDCSATLGIED